MTFSEIWAFTNTIPGSFTELSASKLYEVTRQVPEGGTVVEVGVDQGRSASVLLAAAPKASIILVDSWESVLIDNLYKVKQLVMVFPALSTVWRMDSVVAAEHLDLPIDLIHIDANHYGDHPRHDCESWLPKLKSGGVACWHDYGTGFPDVTWAVNHATEGWEDLGVWDSLAIRRKP